MVPDRRAKLLGHLKVNVCETAMKNESTAFVGNLLLSMFGVDSILVPNVDESCRANVNLKLPQQYRSPLTNTVFLAHRTEQWSDYTAAGAKKHSSPDGRIIKFQLVNKGRASVFGLNCCFHCTGHLLHSHTEECDGCSDCLTHTLPLTQVVGLKANRVKTRPGIVNLKFGRIFF